MVSKTTAEFGLDLMRPHAGRRHLTDRCRLEALLAAPVPPSLLPSLDAFTLTKPDHGMLKLSLRVSASD